MSDILSTDFISSAMPQKIAPKINKSFDPEKTRQAVQDFEAFFISQTFEQMYAPVPINETFGGGTAEKIFRSRMIGGIGLTDQIMTQILRQQQADTTAPAKAE